MATETLEAIFERTMKTNDEIIELFNELVNQELPS